MPSIDFLESAGAAAMSVRVEGRSRLLDACDDARAPVRFGCRAARCTTCRVEVLEGIEALEPADVEEAELLQSIGAEPDVRLACQVIVRAGNGKLRLRWIGPESSVRGPCRHA